MPHSAVSPVNQRHVSLPNLTGTRLPKALPPRPGLLTPPLLEPPTAALARQLSSKRQGLQFRGDASLEHDFEAGTLAARPLLQPTRAQDLAPVPILHGLNRVRIAIPGMQLHLLPKARFDDECCPTASPTGTESLQESVSSIRDEVLRCDFRRPAPPSYRKRPEMGLDRITTH